MGHSWPSRSASWDCACFLRRCFLRAAPKAVITACIPYGIRQQIGHYLYVADRVRNEVVVLNSNRFTVLDRITVPDPTEFAVGTNMDFLAVTNQSSGVVSFIDIDPVSSTFHQVLKTVQVGKGPTGIAWEPGNEDIMVCNEADSTVSIISAFSLEVRKTLGNQLNQPFDVAITPRQTTFGFMRGVYFAYFLNRDGTVSLFESGPDGVNGIGFDDIIGQPEFTFKSPKAITPDYIKLQGGVWVAHEGKLNPLGNPTGLQGGAISNMVISSATSGAIPLDPGLFVSPQLRDIEFEVPVSIGGDQLTGIPVDIAFDNQRNLAALTNWGTIFSAGTPVNINGKAIVRVLGPVVVNTSEPRFMFVAVPNSDQGGGVVDVLRIDSGFLRFDTNPFQPGIQSIPAPGANIVMDYFRQ